MTYSKTIILVLAGALVTACMGVKGDTNVERRAYVDEMNNTTLVRLYEELPEAKIQMSQMAGHAVFSSLNTNIFMLRASSGYGVAERGGKKTYMKMYSAGVGLGMGVKGYQIIFMFRDKETYNKFVEEGWEFGGNTDTAEISREKGVESGSQASIDSDIIIYSMTEEGLALKETVAGTRYWQDDELN